MAEGSEIDLYENVEDSWKRESLDLYENVENGSNNSGDIQRKTKSICQSNHTGMRVATYVGNLKWWTTDKDLFDSLNKLECKDILEIKFHENRQNGQSKGFCVVVFGSDKSAKEAMENLPKSELHGLTPIVTYCSKQNLNYFEEAADGMNSWIDNNNNNSCSKIKLDMSKINKGPLNNINMTMTNNNTNQMLMGSSLNNNMRFTTNNMCMPGLPNFSHNLLFNLSRYNQNTMNRAPNNNSMMMMIQNTISTPLNVPSGQINMSLAAQRLMQQPAMMMQQQPGLQMTSGGPTPHLNPNFFNTPQVAGMMAINNQPFNQSFPNTFGRIITNRNINNNNNLFNKTGISHKLSDNEFEEILQRNKTVSSSAINRAVQDASAGDYASAIETLVTAISLIKQSKIAAVTRCKVLINSLHDTLTGIESKSYGSRKSARNRRCSFSESSSDDYIGDKDDVNEYGGSRRVLRSRSRDRHRRRSPRDYGSGGGRSSNQQSLVTICTDYLRAVQRQSDSPPDRYGANSRYRH